MFNNHFKTALRFLKQNKIFAGINAFGLSVALAASFIMLLYTINELSYDHFHKNRNRVYRVLNYYVNFKKTIPNTPYTLAPTLKGEIPQIEEAIRVSKIGDFKLKLKDEYIDLNDVIATDSKVFDIFTLPLIGSPSNNTLLDDPAAIVLSRDLAVKFFGLEDPIGKDIIAKVNDADHLFIVTGIFENIPKNSSFRAQCFINIKWSIEIANKYHKDGNADKDWGLDSWTTWVLLSKGCNPESLEQQFRNLEIKYIRKEPDKNYSLQNLSDVYLRSNDILYSENNGNLTTIRMFLVIAFLIILVAALNYIILSTAVSTGRAKEIGIRKTLGAGTNSVRNQLLYESIILAVFVLPMALVMMWLSLPYAGKLFQTDLNIIKSNVFIYSSVYFALTLFIGVASGIYTSYYLSRLKVTDILKPTLLFGKRKQFFRSSLIILQLVIFCSFVSGTLIIRSQYQYALKTDPGFYTRNILLIDLGADFKGFSAFLNSVKSYPDVLAASGTGEGLPIKAFNGFLVKHFQDNNVKVPVQSMNVDYSFLSTMGINLIKGRDFSEEFGSDESKARILNETAVKLLGITDPIGKPFGSGTIIGIVKDFNIYSIRSRIPPVSISLTDSYIHQVIVHYKPGTLKNLLSFLKPEWKKIDTDMPFTYSTIEEHIKDIYSSERNLSTIVSIFALFTLLIATIGLFGLTLFVSKTRTKEIGIKKIFGSSEGLIVYSFLRVNFILVLLASLFSIPVTLYVMTKWLNNYSYKVHISWLVFAIPFAVSTIVVLLTVFIHSYKTSRINPVKALRYE
jgi:putative ABC transport system permease protein